MPGGNVIVEIKLLIHSQKRTNVDPPIIPSSFLNGITHKWKRLRHQRDLFDDYMNEIFTRNGPTHAVAKGSSNEIKMIYTIEPANIRTMLSTNFSDYHRPQTMPNALNPVMGRGVFTSNGAEWAHSRGLVRAQFSIKRIRHVRKLEVHVQNIFEALGDVDEESGWTAEQEILSIFDRFTLDAATEFMFGTSAASHEAAMARRRPSSETSIRARQYKNNRPGFRAVHSLLDWLFGWSANSGSFGFGDAFDLCLDYVALRLKLGKLWFLADGIAFRLACKQVQRYADDYIREAAAHADEATRLMEKDPLKDAEESEFKDSRIGDDDRKYGLISDLVESYPDKIALRNQVMQLLVAGRDTTAASLTWTFALLEANPQVLQRLIDNIMETFGTESQPRQTINYDTLRACTYLQWVIFEVLRLYPTGPLNARMASCNTVLPLGGGKDGQSSVAVKAGTTVAYNTYLLHRRKEFWGDDAWEFRPERWENRRVGWDYIPFHGGPQTCLGRESAYVDLVLRCRNGLIDAYRAACPDRNGVCHCANFPALRPRAKFDTSVKLPQWDSNNLGAQIPSPASVPTATSRWK